MDIMKINNESGKLLEYLASRNLKPDEKIATLRSAADMIQQVLSCEMFTITMANILQGQHK